MTRSVAAALRTEPVAVVFDFMEPDGADDLLPVQSQNTALSTMLRTREVASGK